MNQRLSLFASQAIRRLAKVDPSRKLYTVPIYPYPHKYFNEYKYPSRQSYRESIALPPGYDKGERLGVWCFRFFWAYLFWSFFHDPGALFGHCTFPNPELWTDEELGIPPLEAGPYKDWAESKMPDNE